MAQRRAVTKAQLSRYGKGTKQEKSQVLDTICEVNGWHRDHARKVLRRMARGDWPPPPRTPREPVLTYDQSVIDALLTCWVVLDGPTGKRLQPALANLIPALLAHQELICPPEVVDKLLTMSPATIDRRLGPYRTGLVATKGRAMTKPGSMLKTSIPMKTWHEWDETVPGFIQIDLVAHDGGDNNGAFFSTLDATDIATGWTEAITVRSKGERIVAAGLTELIGRFPFAINGIHSDNGSEFINHHLLRWCDARHLTFTRGRAHHSNDQAYVEQKNWSSVRRGIGYFRYDTRHELDLLNQLWPLHARLDNLFLPQQKLIKKTRQGAKTTKKYDTATTPYQRLARDHPKLLDPLDQRDQDELLASVNPADIRRHISALQASLIELARRRGKVEQRPKKNATYLSRKKIPHTRASSRESTTQTTRAS